MKKGMFITFEGGDGSGKSTQIGLLSEFLEKRNSQVLVTREPGGTRISERIREILLDPACGEMDPMTECMLYAAARSQLVRQVIRPALEKGAIVICDRFLDSSIAYQAYGRQLGAAVAGINAYGIEDCIPDLTIYLKVDPDTGSARIASRRKDRMESESDDFHRRVHLGYEKLAEEEPERIVALDASRSIEEIRDKIQEIVLKRLERKDR